MVMPSASTARVAPRETYLADLVPSCTVVSTLRESLTACLTTAAARDGIQLTTEQIATFVREMANNAAQAVLLMDVCQ